MCLQLNTGQLNRTDAGRDLNVERAWLQGLTGCGIVVAVVDDGNNVIRAGVGTNLCSRLSLIQPSLGPVRVS